MYNLRWFPLGGDRADNEEREEAPGARDPQVEDRIFRRTSTPGGLRSDEKKEELFIGVLPRPFRDQVPGAVGNLF